MLGKTLEEMESSMGVGELSLWQAYLANEPAGDRRIDLLFARLSALLSACHGGKGHAGEYMIDWAEVWQPPQTEEDIQRNLMAHTGLMNQGVE